MKVYLCGPINGCTDSECKDWREFIKTQLPPDSTIDPMRRDFRGREDECCDEIVEGDKLDIMQSTILLVNYDKPSVGTSMEILFAWEQRKDIVVVAPPDAKLSPWLRYHATYVVRSFEAALGLVRQMDKWRTNTLPHP